MNRFSSSIALLPLLLTGCPHQPDTTAPPVDAAASAQRTHHTVPGPLEPRPFQLPSVSEGALSNGISVAVVENHEVPFVYVRLVFESGSWTDPVDQAGLAQAAANMLNEGAGEYSADDISRELRRMASDLSTGAGLNGTAISLRSLSQNVAQSLDLMATVTLEPTFPDKEWQVIQSQYIQDVRSVDQNPNAISRRVWNRLMYGDEYAGKLTTVDGYQSLTTEDLQRWYDTHIIPANASILVGGDTTLEEIQPLLEERFGGWQASGDRPAPPSGSLPAASTGTIYLVDKPGAAQSIVRLGQAVGDRLDPDATAFTMANMAIGGQFTARINMNLREDKGWTYGASAWVSYNHYPGVWNVYSSIVTPHTADGLQEILTEVNGMRGDVPMTQEELEAGKGDVLGSWPLSFEQPGYLLDRTLEVRRYDLPEDWLATYPDRIRAVTLAEAQTAFNDRIAPENFIILIVGDAATVREPLEAIGMPIVQLNTDGTPITENTNGN